MMSALAKVTNELCCQSDSELENRETDKLTEVEPEELPSGTDSDSESDTSDSDDDMVFASEPETDADSSSDEYSDTSEDEDDIDPAMTKSFMLDAIDTLAKDKHSLQNRLMYVKRSKYIMGMLCALGVACMVFCAIRKVSQLKQENENLVQSNEIEMEVFKFQHILSQYNDPREVVSRQLSVVDSSLGVPRNGEYYAKLMGVNPAELTCDQLDIVTKRIIRDVYGQFKNSPIIKTMKREIMSARNELNKWCTPSVIYTL